MVEMIDVLATLQFAGALVALIYIIGKGYDVNGIPGVYPVYRVYPDKIVRWKE